MKSLILLIVIVLVALALLAALKKQKTTEPTESQGVEPPKKKRLMTQREEAMYNRLTDSLPDKRILAQVSLGALLSARTRATRNSFDRKIADFVVCDKALQVIAVIELDDESHKSKEDKDKARDSLLTNAGYRVIRYSNVPDIRQVQDDFATPQRNPEGATNAVNHEPTGKSAITAASPVLAREAKSQ